MRISVLGDSDTSGRLLAPGEKPWPTLIQERLETQLRQPVEVDSWRFAPYRPGAVPYAMQLIDEAQPDYVVVPIVAYWCGFATVQSSVEQRFGKRAGALYGRAEREYRKRFEAGDDALGLHNSMVRTLARKALGVAPLLTLNQYIELYSSTIRELSRRENLQVIICWGHHFSAGLREVMRGMESSIARIEAVLGPLALERRFRLTDFEQGLCAGGRREEMLFADGVHMTREGHERTANMLAPLFETGAAPA